MPMSRLESDLKLNWYSPPALPLDSLHLHSSNPMHTGESSPPEDHSRASHAVNAQLSVEDGSSDRPETTTRSSAQVLEVSHVPHARSSRSRGVINPSKIRFTNGIKRDKAVSLKFTLSSER